MKRCFALLFITALCALTAAEKKPLGLPPSRPGKICVLVADVGTIDTVAKTEEWLSRIKQFNIQYTPKIDPADKAAAPGVVRQEIIYRTGEERRLYDEYQLEIVAQNRRMEAILEQLRTAVSDMVAMVERERGNPCPACAKEAGSQHPERHVYV